ncbi:MAG: agmatinase family protein [Proteobacteria bacterium]|nr:agmatinase family protein [Pseudomonadota bacterium]
MSYDPDQAPLATAGLFGLPFTPEEAQLVIVPVPWDATTSYRAGTANGPAAIRAASHQLDLYDVEFGEAWRAGIAMLDIADDIAAWNHDAREDAEPIIAVGGRIDDADAELQHLLARVNTASERLDRRVYAEVDALLAKGKLVGIVGGDHSVPFGAIERHAQDGAFGILHIDAHADLRDAYEGFVGSHASIMRNVMTRVPGVTKLVQVGIRDLAKSEADFIAASNGRIVTHFDQKLAEQKLDGRSWRAICDDIVASLPPRVYVSFDIDGLDPQLCPHTGTPVPGGLSFQEACMLLRQLVAHGRRIIGFDLNEVAPGPDGDEWDANVGARILYKLCGWTLASRRG